MAIATLSKEEQAKLRKHGHYNSLTIGVYRPHKIRTDIRGSVGLLPEGKPDSITVECTRCGEVLVELIGGREQDDI
jgi:hypothetical protein